MNRLRWTFFFSLTPGVLLFFSTLSFGQQWQVVNDISAYSRSFVSGFFFDEFTGFIASEAINIPPSKNSPGNPLGIFKTTDGGKTWIRANIPQGYIDDITQIFMTDRLHGWATVEFINDHDPTHQSIWETIDGGLTWTATGPKGQGYNNIYETPSAVVALSRNEQNGNPLYPTLVSTDKGKTFQPTLMTLKNGIDFADDLHGVMTGFTDGNTPPDKGDWRQTSNGGVTWSQITPVQNMEAWSVYAVKGTSIFYAAPEGYYLTPVPPIPHVTRIFRSADTGSTWSILTTPTIDFLSTGHIAGVGEILYIQADKDDPALNSAGIGMYRSLDQGVTWKSVDGPSFKRDTRFIVTGCNGGVVYAFDKYGKAWKTRTGGDGAISEPPVELQVFGNPIIFSGPICSTSYAELKIANLYCKEDTILSATIADTTSAIISSGALTISGSLSFPLFLASGMSDSLRFIWQPSKIFHTDTTVTIKVKVRYFSKALQQTFDTIVTVSVHAIGAPPSAEVTPINADFGKVSFCNPHDTLITIKDTGCDTLFITKANLGVGALYSVTNPNGSALTLPIIIPPGASAGIHIHLLLSSTSNYTGNLILTLKHQGILRDTSITISASGISTPGKLVSDMPTDTLFDLKLTRCDTSRHITIHLSNPQCAKITIISAVLEPPAAPNILLSPTSLPTDLSSTAGPNNFPLSVTVSPILLGSYSGRLHIVYKTSDGILHDTLMSYFLTVGYGSRILSTNVDTINLGTMKLCDSRDSAVLAKDIGCDSLAITGIQIQGNGAFTLTGNPQMNLAAEQISRIPFHFDPIGAGDISGTITVTTISDSIPIRTIVILAHVTPTDTVTFNMLPVDSCFYAGDTMTIRLVPQQNIFGKGLQRVSFTLHFNGDLLTMEGSPMSFIPGITIIPGGVTGTPKNTTISFYIQGNPTLEVPANQPIFEQKFYVTLTDSISTTFDLTDIQLNGSNNQIYERCELGILSASHSYSICYRCGDSLLVKFMQLGNNLNIFTDAVYPNPLSDQNDYQAALPFITNTSGIFTLQVYDAIGHIRPIIPTSPIIAERPGKYYFTLDGRNLPGGCYYYLLQETSNSLANVRGRFIIAK